MDQCLGIVTSRFHHYSTPSFDDHHGEKRIRPSGYYQNMIKEQSLLFINISKQKYDSIWEDSTICKQNPRHLMHLGQGTIFSVLNKF